MLGLVRSRLRAHLLLPAAAMLTVLLTTTVLTTLTAFAAAVGDTGVRRHLEARAASRAVVDVHSTVTADSRERVGRSVRKALDDAFGALPVRVAAATRSGSYALPGVPRDADGTSAEVDLTLFTSLARKRVRLTHGRWPAGGARPTDGEAVRVPVAVPERAADRLGLHVGEVLRLESRLNGPPPVRAEITGIYVPEDRNDPYWRLDPLNGDGIRRLSYTTYGPLAVSEKAFAANALTPAETYWQADADFTAFDAGQAGALRSRVATAVEAFADTSGVGSAVASSDLPDVLAGLDRSLLVSRSTLLVAELQLAALAALTLLLVAQLLAAERAEETALLRARGASRARIAALAGTEGLLLALPGLLLAPLIAMPAVRALTANSALAAGAAGTAGSLWQLPAEAWWVAVGASLACGVTVALPAFSRSGEVSLTPRRRRAAALLRGGLDLALLGVAGVAVWQLARRTAGTGVLTGHGAGAAEAGAADALGIDPVLVTAPALALLATTVPALRALPLIVRLGERHAARGRGLTAALAGWQLGRRPARGAGPALLLVLAVAMGVFAVGQGASWDRSQSDQATFTVGADVAVKGSSAPAFGQGGLFAKMDGVTAVAPVARESSGVGDDRTHLVLTDTRAAGELLHLRDDLTEEPLPALLAPPDVADATPLGLELPGAPQELKLRMRLETEGDSRAEDASVSITVEDRFGVPYRFGLGRLPADGRLHTLTARLAEAAGAADGAAAGPLRLTRFTVGHIASTRDFRQRLTVERLLSVGAGGDIRTVERRSGRKWSTTLHGTDSRNNLGRGAHDDPELGSVRTGKGGPRDALLTVTYTTGSVAQLPSYDYPAVPVDLTVRPAVATEGDAAGDAAGHAGREEALSGVATDAFLRATDARPGETVQVQISGHRLPVRITAALRALPTAGAGPALLLDLAAVDARLLAGGVAPLEPESWWLGTRPGESGKVAAALRAHPSIDTVVTRAELASTLRSDPLGAGPRTALTAIAVAAAALAATGFAMSTAGAARERRSEFAVLRALGAPRARLARVLAMEQGMLVLLALAVGLVLGVLLTRLVVPLIVLTPGAATPVPPLIVQLPAGRLALLVGAIAAVPLPAVAVAALRGTTPATTLRTERGE